MWRWGFVLGLVLLAVVGSGVGVRGVAAQATPEAADGPRMTEERAIEIDNVRILTMSPDGQWLAATRPAVGHDQLCVFSVETLAERACADLEEPRIDLTLDSVAWSPDSTRLAFNEDAFITFRDGDLWVMEAATGELTNLTDDGFVGGAPIFDEDEGEGLTIHFDILPTWAPDSQSLAFTRSTLFGGDFTGTEILTIGLDGGEPEPLLRVSPEIPGVVYFGMSWTPDGTRLVYTVANPDRDDPANGLWVVDADGQNAEKVLRADDARGVAVAARVAGDGTTALIYYPMVIDQIVTGSDYFALLDLETGTETSVAPPDDSPEFSHVRAATLSPDGSILLTATYVDGDEFSLYARDLATGEETLLTDSLPDAMMIQMGRGITWATDGTVFLSANLSVGTLFRLAGIGQAAPVPAPPAATPEPMAAADGEVAVGTTVVANDANVAMRAAPSTEATVVLELEQGTELTVIGEAVEGGGFTWWPVIEPTTRTIGYVRAELISRTE